MVQADKAELGITLSDSDIQGVSKNVFHNHVKKKAQINMVKKLNELKQKHSKAKYLSCSKMKPAEYIDDPDFNTQEKQLLFKLRSKTLDVKANFKGLNSNPWCISCGLFPETQSHLLQCPQLVIDLTYLDMKASSLNENYIYGNLKQQKMIIRIYNDIIEVREKFQKIPE